MEEIIRILTVVLGPMAIYWTAAGILYAPELLVGIPFSAKAALTGIGAVLVTIGFYLSVLGSISQGLVMLGFVLLVAPIAATLVNHVTLVGDELILTSRRLN